MTKIRANPAEHPLRRELLRAELLPYQLAVYAYTQLRLTGRGYMVIRSVTATRRARRRT